MQKLAAANGKTPTNNTIFISHMSDYILKKVMIKWNTLIINYTKTETQ